MKTLADKIVRFLGILLEIRFWRKWFKTHGFLWPEEYKLRLDPTTPLDPALMPYLAGLDDPIQILDVGAGPLTALGKVWEGHHLQITAVDPLAHYYQWIMDSYRINPPVRTQKLAGEELSTRFPAGHFDFVFSRNAIDHSVDPLLCIQEMIKVAKVGKTTLLIHQENEGVKEKYVGLHHWNFTVENGDFIIKDNADYHCNVTTLLAGYARVTSTVENGFVSVQILKCANPPG